MRRASSQTLIQRFQESDREEQARNESKKFKLKDERKTQQRIGDRIDDITQQVTCMTIYKRKGEEFSWEKHGLQRQEMRTRAARLEKQLKARWSIEQLIDEQLSHFRVIYNRVPTTMKDVTQLLMPKEASAHELAATSWLGDWRPTMILELSRSLIQSSSDSAGLEQVLLQLINDVRIEEAVIDEEMSEIQATCVLHLPFSPLRVEGSGPPLACMQSEFKKIHRVVTKAQNLRLKAVELVVKKVLSKTDAAEFLVAFTRFQDAIHHFAIQYKLSKGTVSVPVKVLGGSSLGN